MSVELAFREYGDGPPLLILHGLFGSARNWHSVAQRLADSHRVYALDSRNHGESPWADTMDYFTLAGDVERFIADHGLDQPAVLGHSMGGKTAMVLALQRPELIARLIVVDIAPVDYLDTFSGYIAALQALDLHGFSRRGEVDATLRAMIPQDDIRAFLLQNLVPHDDYFDWRLNLSAIGSNIPSLVGFPGDLKTLRYTSPARFVCGAVSDHIQQHHHDAILRLFPAAVIDSIANAGHWVHVDQPQRLAETVHDFLTSG